MEKFYITTAIAYTSKIPHIGNTYEAVLTDAIARYKRERGYDVYFLTGTDEHGEKIETEAKKNNRTPKEHVDIIAKEVQSIWDTMEVSYDQFIRTTDPKHEEVVKAIFKKFYDQGDIYKGYYEGHYCTHCESFYTDTQVENGHCPECGDPVQESKEEAYFFRLSKYQDWLLKYFEDHPEFISPESRKKEMINNFLKPGLKDLCVSRTSFDWGIPVEFDPGHVVYVWLDALTNYISAIDYKAEGESGELFKNLWPADLQVVGKDIIRFHTIYWPIFLHALGLELPKHIYGHPWVLANGGKMSKTIGNTLYAKDLVERFGLDRVRYVLLRDIPFADDGDLTPESIVTRTNMDLSNILGNLFNRTLAMSHKYFAGKVQKGSDFEAVDKELIKAFEAMKAEYEEDFDRYHVANALEDVIEFAKKCNKYIDDTTPWVLSKDPEKQERLKTVLYVLTECLRLLAILIRPFLPSTSKKMLDELQTKKTSYESATFGELEELTVLEPVVLFERLEAIEEEEEEKETFKPEITFDDFEKIDLRVCEVLSVEDHPKADRLYVLKVRVGKSERTVVSGIKAYYKKEELVGMKLVLVANLKPAKLRGVESFGMLIAEEYGEDVRMIEATLPSGSEIG
ncbi:methionine--tRNA ligase [Guggenheimella bovis]